MSKDKVQQKQNIHTTGCETLLDSCYNDSFIHSHIKLGKLHKIQGPMQSREKVRILPIGTIWNQSWWSRKQGKIRGFPQIPVYKKTEIFQKFSLQCCGSNQGQKWKNFSLMPTLNENIKICERAIRMGDCAKFNCTHINLKCYK